MITFRRRTLIERLLRLIPHYARKQDAETEAAIRRLVADPALPCAIEKHYIPGTPLPWMGASPPAGWQWYGLPNSGWIIKL